MPRKTTLPTKSLSETNGLRFEPQRAPLPATAAPVEPKVVAPRQPEYAWEMTLDQFRERFFPELCSSSNDDQQQQQRIAA